MFTARTHLGAPEKCVVSLGNCAFFFAVNVRLCASVCASAMLGTVTTTAMVWATVTTTVTVFNFI
jgi:hypothetical protein